MRSGCKSATAEPSGVKGPGTPLSSASKLPDYVGRRNHGRAGSLVWHQLPLRNAMDLGSVRGLARILTERSIDIVHAHVARDYPVVALATTPGKD